MRGPTPSTVVDPVARVCERAPDEVNVYTDGSIKWLATFLWATGGAGLSVAPQLVSDAPPPVWEGCWISSITIRSASPTYGCRLVAWWPLPRVQRLWPL
eukprot:15476263-Alexandrium_andersonii.AAC.1